MRLTWPLGLLLAAMLLTQATWIFLDARRRGENQWLWGFFGLLNCPSSLLVYLLVTRRRLPPCPRCGRRPPAEAIVCLRCGMELPHPCQGCGKLLAPTWIACPHCGRRVVGRSASDAAAPPSTPTGETTE